jgi:hypothetical protein
MHAINICKFHDHNRKWPSIADPYTNYIDTIHILNFACGNLSWKERDYVHSEITLFHVCQKLNM